MRIVGIKISQPIEGRESITVNDPLGSDSVEESSTTRGDRGISVKPDEIETGVDVR